MWRRCEARGPSAGHGSRWSFGPEPLPASPCPERVLPAVPGQDDGRSGKDLVMAGLTHVAVRTLAARPASRGRGWQARHPGWATSLVIQAAVLLLVPACRSRSLPPPRNAVLIVVDTLRADHLGCYGYQRPTSPNIDKLAASGARFVNGISSTPWTLPSMATIMTGLYPSVHGVVRRSERQHLPGERGQLPAGERARPVAHDTRRSVAAARVPDRRFRPRHWLYEPALWVRAGLRPLRDRPSLRAAHGRRTGRMARFGASPAVLCLSPLD